MRAYRLLICLNVNPTKNAEIIVPIFTAPNMFVYHNPHITSDIITIKASKPIFIVENLQFVTIATDSTHPSPGRGAIFAGMYTNIPKAVKSMLMARNRTHINMDESNGMNDTKYNARFVKYPNSTQLIS